MAHLVISTSLTNNETLITDIKTKNAALGAGSPIKNLLTDRNIDLDDDLHAVDDAISHEKSAVTLRKQSENYNQLVATWLKF